MRHLWFQSVFIFTSLVIGYDAVPTGKLCLWYTRPAKKWSSEALPIGNGFIGGMIFGGIAKDQVQYVSF